MDDSSNAEARRAFREELARRTSPLDFAVERRDVPEGCRRPFGAGDVLVPAADAAGPVRVTDYDAKANGPPPALEAKARELAWRAAMLPGRLAARLLCESAALREETVTLACGRPGALAEALLAVAVPPGREPVIFLRDGCELRGAKGPLFLEMRAGCGLRAGAKVACVRFLGTPSRSDVKEGLRLLGLALGGGRALVLASPGIATHVRQAASNWPDGARPIVTAFLYSQAAQE